MIQIGDWKSLGLSAGLPGLEKSSVILLSSASWSSALLGELKSPVQLAPIVDLNTLRSLSGASNDARNNLADIAAFDRLISVDSKAATAKVIDYIGDGPSPNARNRRPSNKASETRSMLQLSFSCVTSTLGRR